MTPNNSASVVSSDTRAVVGSAAKLRSRKAGADASVDTFLPDPGPSVTLA